MNDNPSNRERSLMAVIISTRMDSGSGNRAVSNRMIVGGKLTKLSKLVKEETE